MFRRRPKKTKVRGFFRNEKAQDRIRELTEDQMARVTMPAPVEMVTIHLTASDEDQED